MEEVCGKNYSCDLANEEEDCLQSMSIPTTTYFYREVKGYGEYTYKLEQIIYQKGCIAYPHTFIEKNSLDVSGMARLEMFNNVFIPEVNQNTLKFAFRCERGVYICAPTMSGRFQILSIMDKDYCRESEESWKVLSTSDLACSMYTVVHDYIETRNKNVFYHVGASPLPCAPFFIPLWVSTKTLSGLLMEWKLFKTATAINESVVVVRCVVGMTTIKKVSDSSQKWKPIT
jgi:hypothetical protein